MEKFDGQKFKDLIEAGKKEEAKKYLESFLSNEIGARDAMEILYKIELAKMAESNELNSVVLEGLKDVENGLKKLDEAEKNDTEAADLANLRAGL